MLPENRKIFPDSQTLAAFTCKKISELSRKAIQRHNHFRIVLSGGSTPADIYKLLAESEQDWSKWEVFWGDERCLPVDHPERNSFAAQQIWLDKVAIPENQIHPIPAEMGAEKAAWLYAKTIAEKLPFDLVLLGIGEDGHTASLFPGNPALDINEPVVPVSRAPKPPAERVSLSIASLRDTQEQIILACGAGKAGAIGDWGEGVSLPVAQVCMERGLLLMDEAAAGSL